MSTSLTNSLAPYVAILEQEITADLSRLIPAERLQDEVRKTLMKEIAKQTQDAIGDLQQAVSYLSSEATEKAEAKATRFIGYMSQLLEVRRSQKLLASASIVED